MILVVPSYFSVFIVKVLFTWKNKYLLLLIKIRGSYTIDLLLKNGKKRLVNKINY